MTGAKKLSFYFIGCILFCSAELSAQKKDSAAQKTVATVAKFKPQTATRRAAILPGWGQATNKEYWKIPIVYGVLAIPGALYFYNDSWYSKTKYAYEAKFKAQAENTQTDC